MPAVVNLKVEDPIQAAAYYESLLAVTPTNVSAAGATLVGDHLQVDLKKACCSAASDITLDVTSGMLARILDAAMHDKAQINVESPETVKFADKFAQRWTLRCKLA